MGENKITRDVYKHYANRIVSVLKDEAFYEQFKKRVDKGSASFKLAKKRLIQDISIDWIDTIESILPNLDTIVRNPRRFIVQEEDIVDVSLARSISTESIKFLAQHTNMISKVDEKTGDVTPSKILNITKEESFEIYENRFIYTLLLKLKDFVTMRYDKIKKASATQDVLELDVESRFNLPSKKITYRTEYFAQLSFDEVMRLDPDTLTKIERVAKIDRIITDFLSSSFAKSMRNSAPVRPPIMRTNVILKEPNFKKALVLWQFIETYQATGGFSTADEVDELPLDEDSNARLREMVTLNTMLFESMYDECETDLDMEDKEFADFLRVGQMDFEKDEINRDEYAQKLEDEVENEEEEENIEEVKPTENDESESEIPEEHEPEVQEKEIEKEVVVERPVEIERLKEMPPKADQEEVDLEPDAEKFDQHLFEVRKMYRRPADDKLRQEDLLKVRDAIDRCLTSYRRIKQEEIDERDRQDRIRRRREDIEKRAEAFRKIRESLEQTGAESNDRVYFGIDPFSYQKAKIAEDKRRQEAEERKELLKNQTVNELDDKDTTDIENAIQEMEEDRKNRAIENEQADNELNEIDAQIPEIPDQKNEENEVAEGEQETEQSPQDEQSSTDEPVSENAENEVENVENAQSTADSVENVAETPSEESEKIGGEQAVEEPIEAPVEEQKDELQEQPQAVDAEEVKEPINEEKTEEVEDESQVEAKEKRPYDPWGLSPTTLNQKYSTPSGRKRDLTAVDESKVQVGGITFKDGDADPFAISGITSNRAETGREVVEDEQDAEHPKPAKKPRRRKTRNHSGGEKHDTLNNGFVPDEQTKDAENPEESVETPIEDKQNIVEDIDNTPLEDKQDDVVKVDDEPIVQVENADENADSDNGEVVDENNSDADNADTAPKSEKTDSEPALETEKVDEDENVLANEKTDEGEDGKQDEHSADDTDKVEENPADEVSQEPVQEAKKPRKPRKPKEKVDPWGLSPTTLNQKYSTPSGRKKDLTAVDENKVAVGGITFKDGSSLDDPFAIGITANRAENYDVVGEAPSDETAHNEE